MTDLPTYVQIEPVGQCNLACQMCAVPFRLDAPVAKRPAFMSLATFERLVDQFHGVETLHLQGLGEPLMHPQFFDMVVYAAAKGIRVTTNTNLTLLSPRRALRCFTSGLDCISISIDAATPEVYERIRRGARYTRLMGNLELLVAARRYAKADRPTLRFVTVLMRQNLTELVGLVRLAARFEIGSVFVQRLAHDFGEISLPSGYATMREFISREMLRPDDQPEASRIFAEAKRAAAEHGIELRLPRLKAKPFDGRKSGKDRCSWPWTSAYVSYQGLSMPCCMIGTPDRLNLGSMSERSVEEIWNGHLYRDFRDRLESSEPPELCRSCSVYHGTF